MRIDGTSLTNLLQSAANLTAQQTSIAQQLSSGARISALSDDPIAAGQSSALNASLSQADSFLASANTVLSRAQASDTALGSVVTQLTSAVSIAIQGANGTANADNRSSLAQQLSSIRDSVFSLANSSYGGVYLFAGSASATPAFSQAADGTVTYNGDTQISSLELQNGSTVSAALVGSSVFSDASSPVFGALQSIITTLQNGEAPDTAAVSNLRDSLTNVTTQRSILDSNMSRLNSETAYTTTQKTETQAEQSKLLSADPVALASELSASETQRTALLSTLAVVQKGSLFDYM